MSDSDNSSDGPPSCWATNNKVPSITGANRCWTYNAMDTCSNEQLGALAYVSAEVKDFVIQSPAGVRLDSYSAAEVPVEP